MKANALRRLGVCYLHPLSAVCADRTKEQICENLFSNFVKVAKMGSKSDLSKTKLMEELYRLNPGCIDNLDQLEAFEFFERLKKENVDGQSGLSSIDLAWIRLYFGKFPDLILGVEKHIFYKGCLCDISRDVIINRQLSSGPGGKANGSVELMTDDDKVGIIRRVIMCEDSIPISERVNLANAFGIKNWKDGLIRGLLVEGELKEAKKIYSKSYRYVIDHVVKEKIEAYRIRDAIAILKVFCPKEIDQIKTLEDLLTRLGR
jgi:hypothetical protein